ncbi:hypothetical protein [Candidatus Electronema sp. TJ]|uniref:hypothetical protein n=1 Tax=Candidatus Electronema sp. TJ TaxID=3401573 RepID=UPI003AA91182
MEKYQNRGKNDPLAHAAAVLKRECNPAAMPNSNQNNPAKASRRAMVTRAASSAPLFSTLTQEESQQDAAIGNKKADSTRNRPKKSSAAL